MKISTKFRGVRYREHPTRKHGVAKDRYFFIRYQRDGKRVEEGLGWASDPVQRWTAEKAALLLAGLKEAAKLGKAEPVRLSERREAERRRREEEATAKVLRARKELTFRQFFTNSYLPVAKASGHDETHFRLWLDPVVGSKPICEIKPFDIERVKARVLSAGRSPRTCEHVLATFRQVWNHARKAEIVAGDSPSRGIKAPKYDNRRQRFLSVEEQERLLAALRERNITLYHMTLLSLQTGLRASEIFKLTWGCVNMDQEMISIMDTKSGQSRTAFMTSDLKAMFESMTRGEHDDLVFLNSSGKPFKEVPALWRDVINTLGFNNGVSDRRQRVCFHSCRHTFASMHAMSGTDMFVLKELMGHKVYAMTARYSHLSPDTMRAATRNLENTLTKKVKADQVADFTGGADHGKD